MTKLQVPKNESFNDYKKRVIDPISSSYCAAKWYNATIWLGSGQTTSCHHPQPHSIPVDGVIKNHRLLHNTEKKKSEREMMLRGERPGDCQYCWKIEDIGTDVVSDRVYKTAIYSEKDIVDSVALGSKYDVNLKTLEVSFDRVCNFACSYCNPSFSTTWANDIKKHGSYNMTTDLGSHASTHELAQLYKDSEKNPFVTAFFKWWETDLKNSLMQLRITGGEPLMSPDVWKVLDWFVQTESNIELAINSNLGAKKEIIDKLIYTINNVKNFSILFTSNESINEQAEYIRDGLNYQEWQHNVIRLLEETSIQNVHIMCTINILCLESLTEFFDWCFEIKEKYLKDGKKPRLTFNLNILRFPHYHSITLLPESLKSYFKIKLEVWLTMHTDHPLLTKTERATIERLIEYLDAVKTPLYGDIDVDATTLDFYNFFVQYDLRRNKNLVETFPIIGQWYKTIPTTIPTTTEHTVIKSIARKPTVVPRNL